MARARWQMNWKAKSRDSEVDRWREGSRNGSLFLAHSAAGIECRAPSAGNMHRMSSSATGIVIKPIRRLPDRAETRPVSHGTADPPKPQMARSEERRVG